MRDLGPLSFALSRAARQERDCLHSTLHPTLHPTYLATSSSPRRYQTLRAVAFVSVRLRFHYSPFSELSQKPRPVFPPSCKSLSLFKELGFLLRTLYIDRGTSRLNLL